MHNYEFERDTPGARLIFSTASVLNIALWMVIFFGLCGAFLSNVVSVSKMHYGPLVFGVVAAALLTLRAAYTPFYIAALVLAFVSIFAADLPEEYLSYFSTLVLPFLWFCVGQQMSVEQLAKGFRILDWILLFGLAVELSGVAGAYFPVIGVRLGDDFGFRYGSFTINPLALGYFASTSALFALISTRSSTRNIHIAICLALLVMANSRGGMATMFIAYTVYFLCRGLSLGLKSGLKSLLIFVALIAIAAGVINSPRLSSMFDWTIDEGNQGRLNQWNYCLSRIAEVPWSGIGAGAMSSIGLGDDPYIEEGIVKSCDSMFLKVGVEYGLPVLGLYSAAILLPILLILSKVYKLRKARGITVSKSFAVAISLTIAVLLQQLLNQTLESIWIGAIFFCLLGYCYFHSIHLRQGLATPQANPRIAND